ncbi:DinB family protein [Fictibacillus sp. KIGAM418]|uniref:DinB family protein n=1 Tax=Fictibacillus marinisediminis TaxID=2878389 RepID=A0A9X1XEL7_9BACL|nr:DinB family protein [Fictibacillus marinisediminis]MCK6258455.1 DinB family protein [Fictibacillus marinisediminis]
MNLELMDIFRMEFDFSWDTETWFLPLESALEGLNSTDASWQPPGGGNTIWQTVNHLNYYNALLVRQINDTTPRKKASNSKAAFGDIGEPADSKWKAVLAENTFGDIGDPADSEKWKAVLAETRLICENLRKSLAQVNDSHLEEEHVGGLARQILHNVYHIGQIVLIRKQQGSWPKERE